MHISDISGHRSASLAIEKTLQKVGQDVQTCCIDGFGYTNPHLEKFVNALYMMVIKAMPKIWDYLYDNQAILKKAKKVRSLIHRLNDRKIKKLFNNFYPDIIVCTQAFPCGMAADYKRRHNLNIPLVGVLTDYSPHSYWLNDFVDIYVVPTSEIKQRLAQRGIPEERLKILGIPIDSKFRNQSNREEIFRRLGLNLNLPVILIMGGGQGLGPIKEMVCVLDRLSRPVQLIVACGTNRNLYKWLNKNKSSFTTPVSILGYTEQINDLMEISTFIISKPGGLTSAEALSKSLPMIIVNPLPGQEAKNTQFLLEAKVALKVNSLLEMGSLVEELLSDSTKLDKLRMNTSAFAHTDSTLKISQLILSMIK